MDVTGNLPIHPIFHPLLTQKIPNRGIMRGLKFKNAMLVNITSITHYCHWSNVVQFLKYHLLCSSHLCRYVCMDHLISSLQYPHMQKRFKARG